MSVRGPADKDTGLNGAPSQISMIWPRLSPGNRRRYLQVVQSLLRLRGKVRVEFSLELIER